MEALHRKELVVPVALDHIHQIIRCNIRLPNSDICVANFIFAQNGLDLILVDVRERHGVRDRDAALVFLTDGDRGWFLVEADAEAFKLGFDDLFVGEGLEDVEDIDEDAIRRCRR